MGISFGDSSLDAIRWGDTPILKGYYGDSLIWNVGGFTDEPKIDPTHPLWTDTVTMNRLTDGALEGMAVGSGTAAVVDGAFASGAAGTLAYVREAFPASNSRTFRVSALIKIDKTAGRYSRIGFASNSTTPATGAPDAYIGHNAGTGIVVSSNSFVTIGPTLLTDAQLVDGAWYRVTLAYDNVYDRLATDVAQGRARVLGAVEPVDPANTPSPWYPSTQTARHDSVGAGAYVPMALVARTNSALGTIKSLCYTDTLFGANSDDAPINISPKMGDGTTDVGDVAYVYSKGKAAPLRIIVTAGGSGTYGGMDFAVGASRANHPYTAFRQFWRELADLGYTVLHTKALHEGWGADDHLTKQLEALNLLQAENYSDARIYYIGYSMGGLSAWRAIMGRAGFPSIRAAYIVAGAAHLDDYYDVPMYSAIQTRWPNRGALDEPINFDPAQLVARGTRVRMVTSTADINVPKTYAHDPMVAKFAAAPELISELVHAGIDHFDPAYWNAADCVAFFEGADL